MNKFYLIMMGLLLSLSLQAQHFSASNSNPCEGEEVIIKLDPFMTSSYFGSCFVPSGGSYSGTNYYKYTFSYSTGTFSVTNGVPVNSVTSSSEIKIVINPNSWNNPGNLVVYIQGYRTNPNNGVIEECFGAFNQITLLPRKVFPSISGTSEINAPGQQVYSIGNVPGVTMNWSVPSGWVINSGQSTTSITTTPNSNSGNVIVTTTPVVNACNYPASKAVEVTDCFTNGQTEYSSCSASSWSTAFPTSGFGSQNKWPRMIGDFNGDGRDDVIGFGNTAVVVGLSNGSAFSSSTWTTGFTYGNTGAVQDKYPRMIGDFNGDGRDDIVVFGHNNTEVGLSTGTSFSTSGFSPTTGFTYSQGYTNRNVVQTMIGDFNGDGRDDVVGFGYTQTGVGLSTGSSFSISNWTTGFTATTAGFNDMNKYPKMIGDFNGDGRDDVVGFGQSNVTVGLSTGTSFNTTNWTTGFTYGGAGYEQRKFPRMIGDFNGDGMDDVVGFGSSAVAVGISTGSGFNVSNWLSGEEFTLANGWNVDGREIGVVSEADFGDAFPNNSNLHEIRIGDANGDGLDDIIGYYTDGVYISYSTGTNFQCPAKVSAYGNNVGYNPPSYIRQIGNFDNSDDAIELIGFGYSDVAVMNCFNDCPPDGDFTLSPASTRLLTTGVGTITVNSYCSNVVSSVLNASLSKCYKEYRVEIIRVDPSTLATIGSPINQIPVGGGWTTGIIPNPQSFSLNGLVVGNLYRLQLFVRRGSVVDVTTKYIEKKLCKSYDPNTVPTDLVTSQGLSVSLYPNPTNLDFIQVEVLSDETRDFQIEVISPTGQVLKRQNIQSNGVSNVDIEGLAKGTYLFRLENNESIEIIRFLKE